MRKCLLLAAALLVAGCSHLACPGGIGSLQQCAARVAGSLAGDLDVSHKGIRVLVAAPVDAVSLSPGGLGLAFQELLMSALAREGVSVADVQLRKEPYLAGRDGLIALSRDAGFTRDAVQAEAIVVSTYLAGGGSLVVTARVVDFSTNDVIASATARLADTHGIRHLLRTGQQEKVYEK